MTEVRVLMKVSGTLPTIGVGWHIKLFGRDPAVDPTTARPIWVSFLYAVPPLTAAWLVFRRRDVAT
jgi:hypothetical protein